MIDDQFGGLLSVDDAKDCIDCRGHNGSLEAKEQHDASKSVHCLQTDQVANGIAPAKGLVPSLLWRQSYLCHKQNYAQATRKR